MDYKLHEAHSAGHDEELWNALSRATRCQSMICCGTAQKGVRTNTLGSEKELKVTGLIAPFSICLRGSW